ncbi:MAG: VanZ family protein [Candidatus Krumholzibacteriia bacterium]|nr:VanZ family protein [bacterium]MCB9512717.1 VanZ family protein [Candidatus Latescibacterota bacterium]MCB9516801.1 VanZ family protein [Candidatus Latescibacterota bacterium]
MRRPWLLYLLLIFGLSSIPTDPRPKGAPLLIDKVAHFVLYSGLGYVFARGEGERLGRHWRTLLGALLLASAVGMVDEFYQGFVPNRSRELADWLADVSGGLTGAVLGLSVGLNATRDGEGGA